MAVLRTDDAQDTRVSSLIENFQDNVADIDFSFNYDDQEEESSSGRPLALELDDNGNPQQKKASIISCVINLLNTVAGAGMLGLPGAYAGSGFFIGTILLFTAAFFSAIGLHLLSVSATTAQARMRDGKPASFYNVAVTAMPQFAIAIDAAVALKCFGVATGYFVTVGDCMVDSFHYVFRNFSDQTETTAEEIEEMVFTNRQFWIISALLFVLPISFFKTLSALKFTSTLSLILIYALAVGIVLYAQGIFDACENNGTHYYPPREDDQIDDTCRGETDLFTDFDDTIKNLSIFVFSFTCHQNVFTISNELKRPTQQRIDKVIILAISSALILYMIVAIEGYRTYGSEVKGDILLNYPQTGLVTMMRIGIAIMVILSYPLQLDPSRRCLTSLVYALVGRREKRRREQYQSQQIGPVQNSTEASPEMFERLADTNDQVPNNNDDGIDPSSTIEVDEDMVEILDSFLFYGITCVFLVLSFAVAMMVSDLGIILGVVGATGSTMVSYILPGKALFHFSHQCQMSSFIKYSSFNFYINSQERFTSSCIQNHIH
jgi:amino acid permease